MSDSPETPQTDQVAVEETRERVETRYDPAAEERARTAERNTEGDVEDGGGDG